MIKKEIILDCVKEPMEKYHQFAMDTIGNWRPLIDISERILAGQDVSDDECSPIFHPMLKFMKLIMRVTENGEWDWANPDIQNVYKEIAESPIYYRFADTTVELVTSILKKIDIGTIVEIGAGPGQVTTALCREITERDINIPIVISDKTPNLAQTAENLRNSFPHLTISDFVWDFQEDAPNELMEKLKRPVLLFDRFCLIYGGYDTIHKVAPIADIFIMVEDLNLNGKKEAYDVIYERIGAQFFVFDEVKKRLAEHFSFIHTCDIKTIETLNTPITDFTLALKETS